MSVEGLFWPKIGLFVGWVLWFGVNMFFELRLVLKKLEAVLTPVYWLLVVLPERNTMPVEGAVVLGW